MDKPVKGMLYVQTICSDAHLRASWDRRVPEEECTRGLVHIPATSR